MGLSNEDFDAMFDQILTENSQEFDALKEIAKMENHVGFSMADIEEIGINFVQSDLEAHYMRKVAEDPNLTEYQKNKLLEEFRRGQLEVYK